MTGAAGRLRRKGAAHTGGEGSRGRGEADRNDLVPSSVIHRITLNSTLSSPRNTNRSSPGFPRCRCSAGKRTMFGLPDPNRVARKRGHGPEPRDETANPPWGPTMANTTLTRTGTGERPGSAAIYRSRPRRTRQSVRPIRWLRRSIGMRPGTFVTRFVAMPVRPRSVLGACLPSGVVLGGGARGRGHLPPPGRTKNVADDRHPSRAMPSLPLSKRHLIGAGNPRGQGIAPPR
jgi:hypothetical protein